MKNFLGQFCKGVIIAASLWMSATFISSQHVTAGPVAAPFLSPQSPPLLSPTPFFRYPVIPNAQVSGYLDHNGTYPINSNKLVTFFNDRKNTSTNYGYTFSCPELGLSDWVACEGPYSSEASCPNSQELWYDGHTGTDFEYAADWHETGAICNRSRFSGITRPVYAPADGIVVLVQTNDTFNGNAIFIKHDLNGDGNYNDDNIRSAYLHFADGSIAVSQGQTIVKGQYLGPGGMTGKAYTPHLHFEVQRSNDPTFTTKWPVDPFGWTGAGSDPWPYANYPLWRYDSNLPVAFKNYPIPTCSENASLIQNGNFEQGQTIWTEQSNHLPLITSSLPVSPTSGTRAADLGRSNLANDVLQQGFIVPTNTEYVYLRYWVWIAGWEDRTTPYDYLYVRLRDPNGTIVLDHIIDSHNAMVRGVWFERKATIAGLGLYAGQSLLLSFEAVNDIQWPTTFLVDDVQFFLHCGASSGSLRVIPEE
jgi:hypothetical protein